MAEFDKAHWFTAKWEGGISDHPSDRGGYTAFGVSTEFLKDFVKTPANALFMNDIGLGGQINRHLMKKIDAKKAALIFRRAFWEPLKASLYRQDLATVLYDAAVNCGKSASVKFAQRAFNDTGAKTVLAVDGIPGPKSHAAFLSASSRLAVIAIQKRRDYFNSIASNRPSQKVFLRGWLNRANDLAAYISKFADD